MFRIKKKYWLVFYLIWGMEKNVTPFECVNRCNAHEYYRMSSYFMTVTDVSISQKITINFNNINLMIILIVEKDWAALFVMQLSTS